MRQEEITKILKPFYLAKKFGRTRLCTSKHTDTTQKLRDFGLMLENMRLTPPTDIVFLGFMVR